MHSLSHIEHFSLRSHVDRLQRIVTLDASPIVLPRTRSLVVLVKLDNGCLTCTSEDYGIIREFLRKSVCCGEVKTAEALLRAISGTAAGTAASADGPDRRLVAHDVKSDAGHLLRIIVGDALQHTANKTGYPVATETFRPVAMAGRERYMGKKQPIAPTWAIARSLINDVYRCCHSEVVTAQPTLVHYAILAGSTAMIACLVRWGADVSTTLMSLVTW
eukprot:scpid88720/ scgid14665/ 